MQRLTFIIAIILCSCASSKKTEGTASIVPDTTRTELSKAEKVHLIKSAKSLEEMRAIGD
jgi:hypothetical protein